MPGRDHQTRGAAGSRRAGPAMTAAFRRRIGIGLTVRKPIGREAKLRSSDLYECGFVPLSVGQRSNRKNRAAICRKLNSRCIGRRAKARLKIICNTKAAARIAFLRARRTPSETFYIRQFDGTQQHGFEVADINFSPESVLPSPTPCLSTRIGEPVGRKRCLDRQGSHSAVTSLGCSAPVRQENRRAITRLISNSRRSESVTAAVTLPPTRLITRTSTPRPSAAIDTMGRREAAFSSGATTPFGNISNERNPRRTRKPTINQGTT